MITLVGQLLAERDHLGFSIDDITELGGPVTTCEDTGDPVAPGVITKGLMSGIKCIPRVIDTPVTTRTHCVGPNTWTVAGDCRIRFRVGTCEIGIDIGRCADERGEHIRAVPFTGRIFLLLKASWSGSSSQREVQLVVNWILFHEL